MHKRICTPQIAMRKRQLSFGFCLNFNLIIDSQINSQVYESQLPFGFCLTFDTDRGVTPQMRDKIKGLNCLSAFVSLSTIHMVGRCPFTKGSQLPFGFCLTFDSLQMRKRKLRRQINCLNCLSAFVSLSTSTTRSRSCSASIAGLNCLSAFVSLSTSKQEGVGPKRMALSQLPFGFCLTLDYTERRTKNGQNL